MRTLLTIAIAAPALMLYCGAGMAGAVRHEAAAEAGGHEAVLFSTWDGQPAEQPIESRRSDDGEPVGTLSVPERMNWRRPDMNRGSRRTKLASRPCRCVASTTLLAFALPSSGQNLVAPPPPPRLPPSLRMQSIHYR